MHNKAEYLDRLSMIITYGHNPSSRFCCATHCCSSLLAAWLSSKWLVKVLSHFMMAKKNSYYSKYTSYTSMIFNRFFLFCDLTNLSISIHEPFPAQRLTSPGRFGFRETRLAESPGAAVVVFWSAESPKSRESVEKTARDSSAVVSFKCSWLVVEPPTPLKMVNINGYYMVNDG